MKYKKIFLLNKKLPLSWQEPNEELHWWRRGGGGYLIIHRGNVDICLDIKL